MRVIGLHGYPQVGKDEIAKVLVAHGWRRVAFADPVRNAALAVNPYIRAARMYLAELVAMMGWEFAKGFREVRELLQRVGTEAGRCIHGEDCWLNIASKCIDAAESDVVLTDVRFNNEADMIADYGGRVYRVTRPGKGTVNKHASEVQIDEHWIVGEIHNDGTLDELREKVERWIGGWYGNHIEG